jgi:hypothetical protein
MGRLATAVELLMVLVCLSCSSRDVRLAQHDDTLKSLGATTRMIADAWLSGNTSGTYTHTALDQTYHLVEQERAAIVRTPEMLQDPRAVSLAQEAERLSRLIASMMGDVATSDGPSARQRLATLPPVPDTQ